MAAFDECVGLTPLDVLVPKESVAAGPTVCGEIINIISNEDGREREGGTGETIEGSRSEDRKRTYR